MFSPGRNLLSTHQFLKHPNNARPQFNMGQVNSTRKFSTSPSHNIHGFQPTGKIGIAIGGTGKGVHRSDESGARVINRDNNYPNNERKTEDPNLSMNSSGYNHCADAMTSAIIIAASTATTSPIVDVGHALISSISSVRRVMRRVSDCPSEDSYIVFGDCDTDLGDLDDLESNYDEEDEASDDSDRSGWDDEDINCQQEIDDNKKARLRLRTGNIKKVHFPDDDHLAEIHHMVMWSFAYRACRKGPWEEYVRDRARFLRRIDCCKTDLEKILQQDHRNKIFQERFATLLQNDQQMQSQSNIRAYCGTDQQLIEDKKKKSPKRYRRRRNGKKRKKNRHKKRR